VSDTAPDAPGFAPDGERVRGALEGIHHRTAGVTSGALADYIPELGRADPEVFGIAAVGVRGRVFTAGEAAHPFTVQSISKPFVYALVLAELGLDAVHAHVGFEPSGEAFNALSFDAAGRPSNPMINAGALVTTSLVGGGSAADRLTRIRSALSDFAGRELGLDEAVYDSERATGHRNRGLAELAKSSGALAGDVDDAVDAYFGQCSVLVTVVDLAVMAATLANGGVNPVTGRSVVPPLVARYTLALMGSCGMYDHSGEWASRVGLPAKSGVSGGIVAASPRRFGLGVHSPRLDGFGNSVRGAAALRALSEEEGLHLLDRP
jgi:glutaminase